MVSELDCSSNIPEAWNLAFKSMCKKDLKVRSTNHFPISIGPNEVKTLHGLVRKSYDLETALTEQSDTSQSGSLVICPRVIRLKSSVGKVSRIPVRVCNLSAQSIKILPKSVICSVSPVKVIDSWEPETEEVSSVTKGENSDIFVETIGSKINRQNLTENELVRTSEVLNRWKHIFSTSFTDIGRTDLVKHEIKLTDNISVKEPYRRIPPGMYEEVRQHLKEMLEAGAIRKSQSSYCSNVVLVKKSDGSLRFCIDLRNLNNKTIKDAYTLPRVEETIDTLIGSKYFTKLDLRSGYWQVEIKEEDKHKTAFSLGPLGFYECNRMAFGLTNAPATFQRLMETCMGDLHLRECLIFLDDILVFSQSFDDHLKRLESAFEKLISKLTNPPILSYADFFKPFILNIDASTEGLGAVLYQNQNGLEHVIAYGSRSLKPSEKLYPAHKLEFLCLKWAVVDKFKDYLYNNSFEVRTDNNPLTYVTTSAKLDATGHRWLAALSNYNFKIYYRSGKSNQDADGLSRRPYNLQIFPEAVKAVCQAAQIDREILPLSESLVITDTGQLGEELPELESQELSTVNWQQEQDDDPVIGRLKILLESDYKIDFDSLQQESIAIQKFWREKKNLELMKGILVRNTVIDGIEVQQIVLPESMKALALKGLHDDVGHQGREKTSWLVKQRFYWVGMDADIKDKVGQCGRCIRNKTREHPKSELVNIVTSRPMELICIDFLSLKKSKGNIEDILVITDHFTKYAIAIPTRNQKALTTARALYEKFICYYGFPERIHSDQGRNFESRLIKELCNVAGVSKSRTTPYHPMGNGVVERFNQTLIKMLGTLEYHQKEDWKSYVPPLVPAYNATKQDTTGYSPHYLMFGWHPKLAIDAYLGIDTVKEKSKNKENYVDKLKKRLDYAYKVARSNTERNSERSKRHYDFRVRNSKLEIGDRVLIRLLHKTGRSKLSDKWERDPYVIVDMPNPDIPVYKVQKESKKGAIRTLHRNLILPFMSISDTVDTEFPKESDRQHKRRDRRQKVLAESESTSSDSSEDDDDDSEFTYMVKKRSGKENIPKGTPNTSRIYHGNDSSESFGATGNHNFDISGADNIDVGRGNSITTQFDSSTVESDHGFPIHSVDLYRSGLSHNSNLSLPNIDDDVLPDTNVFIPRRSIRERNKPDRYGEWVLGSQPVEVWYV